MFFVRDNFLDVQECTIRNTRWKHCGTEMLLANVKIEEVIYF